MQLASGFSSRYFLSSTMSIEDALPRDQGGGYLDVLKLKLKQILKVHKVLHLSPMHVRQLSIEAIQQIRLHVMAFVHE